MVQPRNQELLQQALASSSSLVATAASATLLTLWSNFDRTCSAVAAAAAHVGTLYQAAFVLRNGDRSEKMSAAELCWLSSAFANQGSAVLLVRAAARVLTPALMLQRPGPWVVFLLAALCNMEHKAVRQQYEPPAVLHLWMYGDSLQERLDEAHWYAAEAAEIAAAHAAAAAAAPAAEAAAVAQQAAEAAAAAADAQAAVEAAAEVLEAAPAAVDQAAVLLRCVLQAFGCFSTDAWLATAAYQALQCAWAEAENEMLRPALALLHEQFERRQEQQEEADSSRTQAVQPQSLAQLLLDAAPDLAILPENSADVPIFNRTVPIAADVLAVWLV
jgi:hypothetical protein